MRARTLSSLVSQFPILKRLARSHSRVPVVRQETRGDCGAACLAMVLAMHGAAIPMPEVRARIASGRGGATALALLEGAYRFGLRGRGVRLEPEALRNLPAGAILHWAFDHYVVYERCTSAGIHLIDPARGRCVVSRPIFSRSFTGVALILEPGEGFAKRAAEPSRIFRELLTILGNPRALGRIAAVSLLLQALQLALPSATRAFVDYVIPYGDATLLASLALAALWLVLMQLVASAVRGYMLLGLRTELDLRLSLGFLDHLASLPCSFFQKHTAGDLLTRLGSTAHLREILTTSAAAVLLDGLMMVLCMFLLVLRDAGMAFLVASLVLLQALISYALLLPQRSLATQELEQQARVRSAEVELVTGIETLKSMGGEQHAVTRWANLFVELQNLVLQRGRLTLWLEALLGSLRLLAPLGILVYGTYAVLGGRYSLGSMLGLVALAGAILSPVSTLVQAGGQWQTVRTYTARLRQVFTAEPEQPAAASSYCPRLGGSILLDQVSLRYEPGSPPAVREVSLEIQAGQFVAIVGCSGSGKTSLVSLLLGLYPPTSGRVLFDGMDLRELNLRELRSQLGVVTQHPQIFATTIRQNIALACPATPLPAIEEAARRAHIHDDIAALPLGYSTPLPDLGASLSGGQRQRLALARALLQHPAILVLDEATSALDAVTEQAIQRELASLDCTRVVIAHRLSTVASADLIVVMEGGRIVEKGRHEELLARNGEYARLVAAQVSPEPTGLNTQRP